MGNKGVLIDTSAWVLFLRGDKTVEEQLTDLIREEKAYTSELILFELLRGARSKKEYRLLQDDFSALPCAALTPEAWQQAFSAGFTLKQSGINVPTVDTLLASLAAANGLALLHRDRHYTLLAQKIELDLIEV